MVLSYKDDSKWKSKWVPTNLPEKGGKRKAEALKTSVIKKYSYLETDSPLPDDHITVGEFMKTWLADIKHSVRQGTYEGYEYRAMKIIHYPAFQIEMRALTVPLVDKFLTDMLNHGKINQKTGEGQPLAVRTVREYKNVLKAACDKAVAYGLLKSNPCSSLRVSGKKNRAYQEELLFLTQDELAELIEFMKGEKLFKKLVPITFMCAYYGLRRSELLGLKWDAIDFKKHVLRICRTVVRVRTVDEQEQTKTSASRRELALFPTAEKLLLQIKEEQAAAMEFYGNSYQAGNKVFTWDDGKEYDPNYVSRTFAKATKKFGRPEITLHKLRHTCASLLLDMGWDIKKVQYWLGHEDAQVTLNIYAHYMKCRMNQQADDLEDLVSGSNLNIF